MIPEYFSAAKMKEIARQLIGGVVEEEVLLG